MPGRLWSCYDFSFKHPMKQVRHVLIALLLAAPSLAAGQTGITVSGPVIVATPLPPATVEMEPDEFFNWAIDHNQKTLDAIAKHNAEMRAKNGDNEVRRVTITEKMDVIKHRFGGGVGYGGFGGAGGYSGYTDNGTSPGPSTAGGYIYNYGFGFNRPGNASQTTNETTTKSYELVYRSPAYYGAPAQLINPFCAPKRKLSD